MLPNRMQLSKTVEDQLKRLKAHTGVTPNISARIAFFRSIESGYRYNSTIDYKTDGNLVLDKITWLGKTQQITELLIKHIYPNLNAKQLQQRWAAHVEHGIRNINNIKSLSVFIKEIGM